MQETINFKKIETQSNHSILKADELSIGYQSKKKKTIVASHISIELDKGELVALVGANGIGKSTLLKTLTKVQNPISGSVLLNNTQLSLFNNLELSKALSIVLTEPIMVKNLTVFELVALGRQPYTNWIGRLSVKDIEMINNALIQTNIINLKLKKCFELSDGQLQKVMIARALAQDTALIILDEPTTHLDMYHKAYILKLLKKLTKETNKTILFSSHEIDLAIQLCDKMIVMSKNTIISDTPQNLIEKEVFNSLFPKDMIIFDKTSKSFRVQK